MNRRVLYLEEPYKVAVREEKLRPPAPGQVMVTTLFSALSPGTDLLIYHGQAPAAPGMDEIIPSPREGFEFPLKYGYSAVGRVTECGQGVHSSWRGRMVFSFHHHESHFCIPPNELVPIPDGISPEEALLIPFMETALNLVADGCPLVGEQVVVFGQGILGLLTTALLAQFPLASMVSLDRYPRRRRTSMDLGAQASLDPLFPEVMDQLHSMLKGDRIYEGADLAFEVSGNPNALDTAIAVTGFGGRVVVGSWYGKRRPALDLGGRFYRHRIQVRSSLGSVIPPGLSSRWTRARRTKLALDMIGRLRPAYLITHKFPLEKAANAFAFLDQNPSEYIEVILSYEG